ncbi:hypothetical protein H0H93_012334 [Arthromyces matolae]|nr:hypothetical protein H0H93_012334 [Arthromyces matolae]
MSHFVPTHTLPRQQKAYGVRAVRVQRYHAYGPDGPVTQVNIPGPARPKIQPQSDAGNFMEVLPQRVETVATSPHSSKKQQQWQKWALDSLRRHFANAFYWYQKLVNAKDRYVKEKLGEARLQMMELVAQDTGEADVIVCVDACFTQKRRCNPRGGGCGAKDFHCDTVFLSEEEVADAERMVEELRTGAPPTTPGTADNDGYEHAMKVPLDGCNDSFTAASG